MRKGSDAPESVKYTDETPERDGKKTQRVLSMEVNETKPCQHT